MRVSTRTTLEDVLRELGRTRTPGLGAGAQEAELHRNSAGVLTRLGAGSGEPGVRRDRLAYDKFWRPNVRSTVTGEQ